jgi:hypothetical protein
VSEYECALEDTLRVTKKYCGKFDTLIHNEKSTMIYTDMVIFHIEGNPIIDIPKNSLCYMKYNKEYYMPGRCYVWMLYFTWEGTADWYVLRQDPITGEIYKN